MELGDGDGIAGVLKNGDTVVVNATGGAAMEAGPKAAPANAQSGCEHWYNRLFNFSSERQGRRNQRARLALQRSRNPNPSLKRKERNVRKIWARVVP